MRESPAQVWRALADRLNQRHPAGTTGDFGDAAGSPERTVGVTVAADRSTASPSRAARIRDALRPARVNPYLLRRGWLWY